MKKEEILELLESKVFESESFLENGCYPESHRFGGAYGILKGTLTYILEKCSEEVENL